MAFVYFQTANCLLKGIRFTKGHRYIRSTALSNETRTCMHNYTSGVQLKELIRRYRFGNHTTEYICVLLNTQPFKHKHSYTCKQKLKLSYSNALGRHALTGMQTWVDG